MTDEEKKHLQELTAAINKQADNFKELGAGIEKQTEAVRALARALGVVEKQPPAAKPTPAKEHGDVPATNIGQLSTEEFKRLLGTYGGHGRHQRHDKRYKDLMDDSICALTVRDFQELVSDVVCEKPQKASSKCTAAPTMDANMVAMSVIGLCTNAWLNFWFRCSGLALPFQQTSCIGKQ